MNLSTVAGFQVGRRDAIEKIAQSRASFITGAALVLITAIPRHYDQTYFAESPFWLIGPLLFSFFSGTFLFVVLYGGFLCQHAKASADVRWRAQWRSFMSLFWMTAPIAWLYAIPVERFLDPVRSAEANMGLLAIVAIWRVLLLARVISVVNAVRFYRALAWVLVPACLEVLIVIFFAAIFNPVFSQRILAAMAGLRNPPEDAFISHALRNIATGAFILLPPVLLSLIVVRFKGAVRLFPIAVPGRVPILPLTGLAVAWIALAIPAQLEQHRFVTHRELIRQNKPREALDYMAGFTRNSFPASRRIAPDPYGPEVWTELPRLMAVLQPEDPKWIRQLYLEYLAIFFRHYRLGCSVTDLAQIFSALKHLPEGRDWIAANKPSLSQMAALVDSQPRDKTDAEAIKSLQQLTNSLQSLGLDLAH